MAVFNKKNALIGWAVMEGARIAAGRRNRAEAPAEPEEKPKKRRAGKVVATAAGAIVAAGGVAAVRRRRAAQGPEE